MERSQTRNKHDKDTPKGVGVYSVRGVLLLDLTSGRKRVGVRASSESLPASHQVSATPIKFLTSQIRLT